MAPTPKTHCKRGHEFTPENTHRVRVRPQNGKLYIVRQCKACRQKFDSLRYRNNPKREAKVRHRALNRYYERKGHV